MLGFYISGHPLDKFRDELACFATGNNASLADVADGREVTAGGIVTEVKKMLDKKGNMMAFATIEDFTGSVGLLLFASIFETCKDFLETDQNILVTGKVNTREGEAPKVIASEVLALENLSERYNCQLVIKVAADCPDSMIDLALASLEEYPGSAPVLLAARENGSEVYIKSRKYSVRADFELVGRLKELLGDSSAYLRPLKS